MLLDCPLGEREWMIRKDFCDTGGCEAGGRTPICYWYLVTGLCDLWEYYFYMCFYKQHGDGTDLPTWRYNWIFLIQQYKHVYLINPKKKEIIWLLFQVGLMISLVQLSKGRPSQVQNLPVALSMTWSSSESESGFLTLPQADPDSGKKHSAWGHKLKLTLTPHRHPIIPWMQQSFIFALDNTHVKQYNTTIHDITANKYSRLFIK